MTAEEIAVGMAQLRAVQEDHERRIQCMEEQSKSIQELAMSTHDVAMSVKSMTAEIQKQGCRIKELEDKPAQAWNTMTKTIFTSVVSAMAGGIAVAIVNLLF